MSIDVHFCRDDEADDVVRFLDRHWSSGHVLARHRALFDFQHRDRKGGFHVVVARRDNDPELLGILGVIPTSRYDPALASHDILWLTTWMTRPDVRVAGLGLRLHRLLTTTMPHAGIGTVGNNAAAEAVYRALRFRTGTLTQSYLFRTGVTPRLARAEADQRRPHPDAQGDINSASFRLFDQDALRALAHLDLGARAERPPVKSPQYFAERYLTHPTYAYEVLGVERSGTLRGLLAVRSASHDGASALRVVDYWGHGDGLGGTHGAFQDLLTRHNAEHADLFHHGLPETTFTVAGFRTLDPVGDTIIPNYFEPFEASNVVLRWAFQGAGDPVLFKADADQDRPNQLPETTP